MSETLLLCPFCGSPAHITEEDHRFFAACDSCFCAVGEAYDGCAMPCHIFYTEEAVAEAWNTRITAPLSEELKQLADDANSAADRMIEAADRVLNLPQD